ncbi:MAG TPA: glycerophosphodiester phosphodiesterase [Actinomycetales bacterium]
MTLLAFAHRAGNSLAALERAVALGADVVEADVQDVRGTLEVHHGRSLHPLPLLWDGGRFSHVRDRRLHLRELLSSVPPATTVMLDVKDRTEAGSLAVARMLQENPPTEPVLVCGRHWPAMDPFVAPTWARTVLSARTRGELARLRGRLVRDAAGGTVHHGVSVHVSLVRPDVVRWLLGHVELVMSWPINSGRLLDSVADAGVRGIISDEDDVLRQVVARRGPAGRTTDDGVAPDG